jgi:hypothetical protein
VRFSVLALAACAGCAPVGSFTPVGPRIEATPRARETVDVLRSEPDWKYATIGRVSASWWITYTWQDVVNALQVAAAEHGCDALVLAHRSGPTYGTCIVRTLR